MIDLQSLADDFAAALAAIDAFEVIAARHGSLGPGCSAAYNGLCHPEHRAGAVYLWEVLYENRNNINAQS